MLNTRIMHLPAVLVVKNFVQGIEKYSYEDYLLEFVNASQHFLELLNGKV